jgi:hypothetical protein
MDSLASPSHKYETWAQIPIFEALDQLAAVLLAQAIYLFLPGIYPKIHTMAPES